MNESVSAYLGLASLAIALVSLGVSIVAVQINRTIAVQQRATTTLREYFQLELASAKQGSRDETDIKIAFLLLVAQEVLRAFPQNGEWREFLRDQLEYYKRDLKRWLGESRPYVAHYGKDVELLISDVLKKRDK